MTEPHEEPDKTNQPAGDDSSAGLTPGAGDALGNIRPSDKETLAGRTKDALSDYASGAAFDKIVSNKTGASGTGGARSIPASQMPKAQERADAIKKSDSIQDKLKRGAEDRKSGAKLKDAYRNERRGRSVAAGAQGVGSIAGQGAKNVVGEVAKDAGKAVVKEGAKDAGKLAARETVDAVVPGAGLATAVDLKGLKKTAQDTARELTGFNVGRAAEKLVTGLGKTAAVTLFRASYDWYVIGFSGGLSLIVTWLLGSVLIFIPSAELNVFERLGIVALNLLLLLFVAGGIIAVFVVQCSIVPRGFVLWLATWFSSSANTFNEFCKYFDVLSK